MVNTLNRYVNLISFFLSIHLIYMAMNIVSISICLCIIDCLSTPFRPGKMTPQDQQQMFDQLFGHVEHNQQIDQGFKRI